MAAIAATSGALRVAAGASAAPSGRSISDVSRVRSARSPSFLTPGLSTFCGTRLRVEIVEAPCIYMQRRGVQATAVLESHVQSPLNYVLPTWADFEMGHFPVFWETATGEEPTSGHLVTIWFNYEACGLEPNKDYGIAFNGGFNSPIMCGGEPRQMTRKDRGPQCVPFFTIKINVPKFARSLEFSFTDGNSWDGPYFLEMVVPEELRSLSLDDINQGLAQELATDGACESAIYPDAAYIPDRCLMPAGLGHIEGAHCELDLVPGCTDPESPFYDPFATHDDGSCPTDHPEN